MKKILLILSSIIIIIVLSLIHISLFPKSEYNFKAYINNWNKRFKNLTYNGMTYYDICQDKYNSYLYCKEFNVPTPHLYFYGDINDVDFDKLPDSYVIKSTRGASSTLVFPIKNGVNQFNNARNIEDIKNKLQNKKCIIEEFIKNKNNKYDIPDDYKIFCFNGHPEFILKVRGKGDNHNDISKKFYDVNWNVLPYLLDKYKEDVYTNKSPLFEQMLEYSKRLSKIFGVIRVDFYITDKGAVFGEFTPHPYGGYCFNAGKKYLNNLMKKHNIKYYDDL